MAPSSPYHTVLGPQGSVSSMKRLTAMSPLYFGSKKRQTPRAPTALVSSVNSTSPKRIAPVSSYQTVFVPPGAAASASVS